MRRASEGAHSRVSRWPVGRKGDREGCWGGGRAHISRAGARAWSMRGSVGSTTRPTSPGRSSRSIAHTPISVLPAPGGSTTVARLPSPSPRSEAKAPTGGACAPLPSRALE
eukprot:7196765-Prymnesium_polylepis.1